MKFGILLAFFAILLIVTIASFITSLIIDRKKKQSTNRTFRIIKRFICVICFFVAIILIALQVPLSMDLTTEEEIFKMASILYFISYALFIIGSVIVFINIKNKTIKEN